MNKIDFAVVITAEKCNPNGEPLNGNRPRQDLDGFGLITDVCIKHKIRNRLYDMGEPILMLGNDRAEDGFNSIKSRIDACLEFGQIKKDIRATERVACQKWIDVRAFGAVFAFKNNPSIGIRGPISLTYARSVDVLDIETIQITKSLNLEGELEKKDRATIGSRTIVNHAAYVFYGSIYPQLASLTGLSEEDVSQIKEAIVSLFENDSSVARPAGSMAVHRVYWWEHSCSSGQYSSAKVHKSLQFSPTDKYPYYTVEMLELPKLKTEIIEF